MEPPSPTAPPVAKRQRTTSPSPPTPQPPSPPRPPPTAGSVPDNAADGDTLRLLRTLTATGRPIDDAVARLLAPLPRLRAPVLAALRANPSLRSDLSSLASLIDALGDCVASPLRSRLPLAVASIADVARLLARARNVVVLSGAGVSVSCGVPDFRSPGGLYESVMERFGLSDPQAIFDLEEFRLDPSLFFAFARDVMPAAGLRPSATHRFIAELGRRGRLLRNYSQNIDGLERAAGVPEERLVLCHGSFLSATCMRCRRQVAGEEIAPTVARGEVPVCDECATLAGAEDDSDEDGAGEEDVATARGVFKPDIIFFGENLPERVNDCLNADLHKADLLLVLGTSLQVAPVARIPHFFPPHFPRILVNRELVDYRFDLELLGDCDAVIERLRRELGWDRPPGDKKPEAETAATEDGPRPADGAEEACDESERADKCEFVPPRRFLFKGAKVSADEPVEDDDARMSLVDALRAMDDDESSSEDLAEGGTMDVAEDGDAVQDSTLADTEDVNRPGNTSKLAPVNGASITETNPKEMETELVESNVIETNDDEKDEKTEEMEADAPESDAAATNAVAVNGPGASDLNTLDNGE